MYSCIKTQTDGPSVQDVVLVVLCGRLAVATRTELMQGTRHVESERCF